MDGNENVLPGHKTFAAASHTNKEVNQPKPGASPPEITARANKNLWHAGNNAGPNVTMSMMV